MTARSALGLVLLAPALVLPSAAGEPVEEAKPAIEMRLSPEGCVTGWLLAGPSPDARSAAEKSCASVPSLDAPTPAGPWRLHLSDTRSVRDRAFSEGPIGDGCCAAAAVVSKGGRRFLTAGGYGATQVFLAGKKVLDIPVQYERWMDLKAARVDVPAGETPLYVFTEPRYGKASFVLQILDAEGKPADDRISLRAGKAAADAPARLLPQCMRVEAESAFVRASAPVKGAVGMGAGWVEVSGQIGAVASLHTAPDGPPCSETALAPRTLASMPGRPWLFSLAAKGPLPPVSLLRVRFTCDGADIGARDVRLYNAPACHAAAVALEREILACQELTGKDLPLARVKAEKARLWAEKAVGGEEYSSADAGERWERETNEAEAALTQARVGREPLRGRKGFMERAYTSPIDGSAQPYLLYVPTTYDPAKGHGGKGYPLVVYLHGYVPSYHKHQWVDEMPGFNAMAEAEQAIMVTPFGRSNTDFVTVGEEDVLDVIEETKRLYAVDPARVSLYGYSMGGTGAYTLIGHYPGRFAAAVVIAGRVDYYRWRNLRRENIHPFKRWLIEQDNPIDLAENMVLTPVLVYQASQDSIISEEQPRTLKERMAALGGKSIEMRTFEGDHWTGFDLMKTREPIAWLVRHRREPARSQTLKVHTPKYGEGPLVQVGAMDSWMSDAVVTAAWSDRKLTVSAARNVSFFLLRGQPGLDLPGVEAVQVAASGTGEFEPVAPPDGLGQHFRRKGAKPDGLFKSSRLAGPVKEVFCQPFAVIYGTGGDDALKSKVAASARQFAKDWYDFAKGEARFWSDVDAAEKPDRLKGLNWIMFGTPKNNAVLGRVAGKLPIAFDEREATIAGKRVSLEGRGLSFCFPNPEQPNRLVAVFWGHPYGEYMSINHKWDFLPDFLVFTPDRDTDDTNRSVVAGYFDSRWQFSEGLTWWFEEKP